MATDMSFANKLKQHLVGNPCYKGENGGAFSIRHYAGEVSCPKLRIFGGFLTTCVLRWLILMTILTRLWLVLISKHYVRYKGRLWISLGLT